MPTLESPSSAPGLICCAFGRGPCRARRHWKEARFVLCCAVAAIPMERSEVIAKLKQNEAELKQLGVEHLYLFGSTARGEAREDSDVDLFFDHPEGSLGVFGGRQDEGIAGLRLACDRYARGWLINY